MGRGHTPCGWGPERERHAAAAAIIAALVTAYAAYEQGQTQQAIGKYNQKVAQNEAIARRQAAAIEADNKREQYASILASQRAGLGGAGVISSEGTPLLVQMESAERAALNEARIRYSGEVGARASESEAIIQGYIGKKAAQRGYIQAGASLLQGAADAYGSYQGGGGGGYTRNRPADSPGFRR